MTAARKLLDYKGRFFSFYKSSDYKTQKKIGYVLDLIRFEKQIPEKFFKKVSGSDGIYEIRVLTTFSSIRILCFFDDGDIIVLTNCYQKNKQRIPVREIKLAEKIKKDYFDEKDGGFLR